MIWGNELVKFSYRSNDLNGNLQGNTHQHNGIEFLLINTRLFPQQTGETLTQYLMIRRLNEACVLLNTTSFSIRQVANCVGFSNSAYFCRCFKKKYTISPQQFRHRT